MIGYYSTGLVLNLFSLNEITRRAYRHLGNAKNAVLPGAGNVPEHYVARTRSFLHMLRKHNVVRPGMQVMEVGTGWVHWEALMLRSELECRTLLYDVWDNRSFERFRAYARALTCPQLRARLGLVNADGFHLIEKVAASKSFDEAYDILGFDYLIDESGFLAPVRDESIDFIFGSDTAEHFAREDVPRILARNYEVLRPGGHIYHQIVLTDHLRLYDRSVHDKEYLRYSGGFFDRFLNNQVQYINRLQIPEWTQFFEDAGFEVMEKNPLLTINLETIDVHSDYAHFDRKDLSCAVVQYLLKKPS